MFRNSSILVPTDFSNYANYALKYAVAFAKKYKGTLHFAHVLDAAAVTGLRGHGLWLEKSEADTLLDSMRDHARSRLAHLLQVASDEGIAATDIIVVGYAPQEILRLIDDTGSTMVVLATHGRSGFEHMVFGSVAEKVVRQSHVPVLSIKHPEREFVQEYDLKLSIRRILFPTDLSELSEKALPFAVSLAREFDATLVIFHANEMPLVLPEFMPDSAVTLGPRLEQEARLLVDEICAKVNDVKVEGHTCSGTPFREICAYVDSQAVDLVVMPTHGRSGLGHALFGSVAEKVVRLAKCPVLTIRPEWGGREA